MDIYALDDQAQRRRGKRRRALLAILLASSLATLGAGAMSLAVFTDADATDGSWTAGSVDISVGPKPVAFTATGILPGDEGSQTINVANSGLSDLRYAVRASGADALGGEIQVTVTEGACGGTGAVLDTDDANAIQIGDNAQGAQAGDRALSASTNEDLCFAWILPLATDTGFSGTSATVTYWFDAEQTRNN